MPKKMECPNMDKVMEKLADLIGKLSGVDVDKNSDVLIDAVREFADNVKKFEDKIAEIDNAFKSMVNLSIIIDVKYAGDPKITVVGGDRRQIAERLDEIKERVMEAGKDDSE